MKKVFIIALTGIIGLSGCQFDQQNSKSGSDNSEGSKSYSIGDESDSEQSLAEKIEAIVYGSNRVFRKSTPNSLTKGDEMVGICRVGEVWEELYRLDQECRIEQEFAECEKTKNDPFHSGRILKYRYSNCIFQLNDYERISDVYSDGVVTATFFVGTNKLVAYENNKNIDVEKTLTNDETKSIANKTNATFLANVYYPEGIEEFEMIGAGRCLESVSKNGTMVFEEVSYKCGIRYSYSEDSEDTCWVDLVTDSEGEILCMKFVNSYYKDRMQQYIEDDQMCKSMVEEAREYLLNRLSEARSGCRVLEKVEIEKFMGFWYAVFDVEIQATIGDNKTIITEPLYVALKNGGK